MILNYQYKIWEKILTKKLALSDILNELTLPQLRTIMRDQFIELLTQFDRNQIQTKYLICNANDIDSGSFIVRDLILADPESLIEGIAIASFIIGAENSYIYIRSELRKQVKILQEALDICYFNKLLGKNILNSTINLDVYLFQIPEGYNCYEITTILTAMEGKRAIPKSIHSNWQQAGLYDKPTLIIDVATLLQLPGILQQGSKQYVQANSNHLHNHHIFSVSGHVNNPGNYKVQLGIKFNQLLSMAGGIKDKKKLKAVLINGISSPILPAHIINNLNLDYNSLIKVGTNLGAGGIIIMHEDTCMLEILQITMKFYMRESCGECTLCREGIEWLSKIITRIVLGKGQVRDLQTLENVADNIYGKGLCGFSDRVAISIKSYIKHFYEEFVNKIQIGYKTL